MDTGKNQIANGSYDIRFALYTKDRTAVDPYPSDTDAKTWEETQTVTVSNGIFDVNLGSVTALPANLTFEGTYYLGIRVGTDSEMVPRKKIASTPSSVNSQFLQGKTLGSAAGNIPTLGVGGQLPVTMLPTTSGKLNISLLPTGTGSNQFLLGNDSRLHAQNTDTGTTQTAFNLGSGTTASASNFDLNVSSQANKPTLRYSGATSKWQFSNDGTTFADIPTLGALTNYLNLSGGTMTGDITFTSSQTFPASQISGAIPLNKGGTGMASYTTGDMLYASAGTTLSPLSIGTNGQVLSIAGGIPAWVNTVAPIPHGLLSAQHSDTTPGTVARGDLITGQGSTPTWSRLPLGNSGYFLESNGADVSWIQLTKSTLGLGNVENAALSTWAGSTNLNTLGTITTGTWHGSTLDVAHGGTGISGFTLGDMLYASGPSVLTWLGIGTPNQILSIIGGVPAWVSAVTPVPHGLLSDRHSDTTSASVQRGDLITGQGSSPTWSRLALGTNGYFLKSNGTDVAWVQPVKADVGLNNVENTALSTWTGSAYIAALGTITSGTWNGSTIDATHGGTGNNAVGNSGSVAYSNGSAYAWSAAGSAGSVLLSGGSGSPTWGAVTGGFIAPNSLDFSELKDNMTLDNNLTISASPSNYSINIDSNTLFVDTANNRIGINTNAPAKSLDVTGDMNVSGTISASSLILSGSATIGTLGVNLYSNTSLIPSTTGLDLGSSTNHWANLYADNLVVNGTNVSGTSSPYFAINTGAAAETTMGLRFYRGAILNGYASLIWDAGDHKFHLYSTESTSTPADLNMGNLTLSGNLILGSNTITTSNTTLISNLNADLLDGQHGSYYQNATNINAGTLNVSKGGTGLDGSVATNGQLLIGNGTGYALATLTDGSGIHVTNSAGSITIASTDTLSSVTARGNTTSSGISLTENGNTASSYAMYLKRNTDTSPLGYLIQAQNAASNANLFTVDASGNVAGGSYNGITVSSGTGTLNLGSYTLALSSNVNMNQSLQTSDAVTFAGLTLNGNLVLGANTITTSNTTLVANLNADMLDGQHGSFYQNAGNINAGMLGVSHGGTGSAYFTVSGPSATRTYTFPDTNGTVPLIGSTQTWTANQTFADATSTDDTLGFSITPGGAARFAGTLTNADLTAAHSWILPNADGTVITTGNLSSITSVGTVASGTWNGTAIDLAHGGTNANLTASNGGIVYSTGSALALLSGTPTAGQILLSGASTTPTWSTATYPATAGSSGNLLQSNGTNWASWTPTYISGNQSITLSGDVTGSGTTSIATSYANAVPVAKGGTGSAYFTVSGPSTTRTYTFPDTSSTVCTTSGVCAGYQAALTNPVTGTAAANQIAYWSNTNTLTGVTAAANSILTTNGSNVPNLTAISADTFTQYALLAGRAGGQTLIGGTAANNMLTIQGTSASGNTATNANLAFNVGDAGATTAMTVLNNGNVGIGTATPAATLDVNGSIRAQRGIVQQEAMTATASDATEYSHTGSAMTTVKTFTLSVTGNRIVKRLYWTGNMKTSGTYPAYVQLISGSDEKTVLGSVNTLNTDTSYTPEAIGMSETDLGTLGLSGDIVVNVQIAHGSTGTAYVNNQTLVAEYMPLGDYVKTVSGTDATEYSHTGSAMTTVKTFTLSVTGNRIVKRLYWTGNMKTSGTYPAYVQLISGSDEKTVLGSVNTLNTDTSYTPEAIGMSETDLGTLGLSGDIVVNVQIAHGSTGTAYVNNQTITAAYTNGSVAVFGLSDSTGFASDIAEYIPGSPDLFPGMIVRQASDRSEYVESSQKAYDANLLGVVSTKPHLINDQGSGNIPLALAGRVPVEVSTLNGPIRPGDPITSSDIPGVGMKATRAGQIVGKALDAFDPQSGEGASCPNNAPSGTKCGEVTVLVNVGYWAPDILADAKNAVAPSTGLVQTSSPQADSTQTFSSTLSLEGDGDMNATLKKQIEDLISNNQQGTLIADLQTQIDTLKDQTKALMDFYTALTLGNVVTKDAKGNVDLLGGKLTAGDVEAENEICIKDVCITKDELLDLLKRSGIDATSQQEQTPKKESDSKPAGNLTEPGSSQTVQTAEPAVFSTQTDKKADATQPATSDNSQLTVTDATTSVSSPVSSQGQQSTSQKP